MHRCKHCDRNIFDYWTAGEPWNKGKQVWVHEHTGDVQCRYFEKKIETRAEPL